MSHRDITTFLHFDLILIHSRLDQAGYSKRDDSTPVDNYGKYDHEGECIANHFAFTWLYDRVGEPVAYAYHT